MKLLFLFLFFSAITVGAHPVTAGEITLPPPQAPEADVHIVLVRHAYPACGDLQCDLNEEGYRQAEELALLINQAKAAGMHLQGVYSSGACRTVLTVTPAADAAGLVVNAYPAIENAASCHYLGDGDGMERPDRSKRPAAGLITAQEPATSRIELIEFINRLANEPHAATNQQSIILVADHSNFICKWFETLGVPKADYGQECIQEGIAHTDYADIYWLYDAVRGEGVSWRLIHLENAFDRGIANPYEK